MLVAQHTLETTASPENIWARWVDPSTYPEWDNAVEWAKLDGEFKVGASGKLKPKTGSPMEFTITQVEAGRACSDVMRLPFAHLRFSHRLEATAMGTRLTHVIEVEGILAWVWAWVLGSRMKADLPVAMRSLARLAEHP